MTRRKHLDLPETELSTVILMALPIVLALLVMTPLPATATTVVVNENSPAWNFTTEGGTPATYGFVVGPGTPPSGNGSVNFGTGDLGTDNAILRTSIYAGQRLDAISVLTYWTYQHQPPLTVSLQFEIDYDALDNDDTDQGRMIFDPYDTVSPSPDEWESWNTLAGRWHGNGSPILGGQVQPNGFVGTWTELMTAYPNARVKSTTGILGLKVGTGYPTNWNASADALHIAIAGAADSLWDFETTQTGPTDLLIRDCPNDGGAEPNGACASNWYQSLDIYIDNNDDGIIDPPIQNVVNHLYVRAWNLGAVATNARIKCWFVNPSLGSRFGLGTPGTQIVDAVTSQSELIIPTMNTLPPTPGGQGYRSYFNWLIPTPPPSIHHYCIGCAIENAADPQLSPVTLLESNLAQINYWALALKAGTQPAIPQGARPMPSVMSDSSTVFRETVRLDNPEETEETFLVRVEGLSNGFHVLPDSSILITLEAGEEDNLTFDIVKDKAQHMDAGQVQFKLYKYPEMELLGGVVNDLMIDNYAPQPVSGWSVELFESPSPFYEISWIAPTLDVQGFPERVRSFEIHASPDSTDLLEPTQATLIAVTGADADLEKPGYQYRHDADPPEELYFTVRAMDVAANPGVPAPPTKAPQTTAVPGSPDQTGGTIALYPNTPNPFTRTTNIWFRVDRRQEITVAVYDLAGRLVTTLSKTTYDGGEHHLQWNGRDASGRGVVSGAYVVRARSKGRTESRKIVLLK